MPDPSPRIIAFAEARCEIQSNDIARPVNMHLAGDSLVILGSDVWKEQDGSLTIRDLSSGGSDFD